MNLYVHQREGIDFLVKRSGALLTLEMGLGKTRCALAAALKLYREKKIDRMLVLAPAAVRISWLQEVTKLSEDGQHILIWCRYYADDQKIVGEKFAEHINCLPLCVVSYALLPQKRHAKTLAEWCVSGKTLLVCDESSFLKNRTAKQTKASAGIASCCEYRWLLTGTPIANSPLDLYGQATVMSPSEGNGHNYKPNGSGPLKGFGNWYHFRARYAVLKMMNMGALRFQQVVGYQNLNELTKRFAPYVLRRTKAECLDLPPKTYVTREVQLTEATWKIYQELRRDALLALPDAEIRPESNAVVRILRLCQLTSGHVGAAPFGGEINVNDDLSAVRDVSSEKLNWLVSELLGSELSSQQAVIIWCRWRRERERLQQMLATKIEVYGVFGGQQPKNRSYEVQSFQMSPNRRVLIAQQHAGGFGLNLTAASMAVYLSNSFSHTDRIQSEDRCHRIGQNNPVTYVDIVAVGPRGQRTVDAHVLECLRSKRDLAEMTCKAWRRVLESE